MENAAGCPVVTLENAAFRIRDQVVVSNISWQIRSGQNWVVLGPNGAGKSTLVRALIGDVPVVRGSLKRHGLPLERIGFVSFELQRDISAAEENLDHARHFSGRPDDRTTARQILFSTIPRSLSREEPDEEHAELPPEFKDTIVRLGVDHFLDRPVAALSTGQMRKLLIARALAKSPKLLILDEPFDGLDLDSRRLLLDALEKFMDGKVPVVVVGHRMEEIPKNATHVALLKNGRMVARGERDKVFASPEWSKLFRKEAVVSPNELPAGTNVENNGEEIIRLVGGRARYGDVIVFQDVDWTVRRGENWTISGPNGAGKSTLLTMISADNPQAYANRLLIFGKPRGSGESIWDIKRRIGVVSSEFQVRYRKTITAFETILSGFFDSVGLYRTANRRQREAAAQWADYLGINGLRNRQFDRLSHGEQRMVLLARSMVKNPDLLILDEPCQGLDMANRAVVLGTIDRIGSQTDTQLLYVTHHPEEIPSCTTHLLVFEPRTTGGFKARSLPIGSGS